LDAGIVVVKAWIQFVPVVIRIWADKAKEEENDGFHGETDDQHLRSAFPAFQFEEGTHKYDGGADTDEEVFKILETFRFDETHWLNDFLNSYE
jgi:hypothetical protein